MQRATRNLDASMGDICFGANGKKVCALFEIFLTNVLHVLNYLEFLNPALKICVLRCGFYENRELKKSPVAHLFFGSYHTHFASFL